VGYGQSFLVSTPDQVSRAVLVAPGAVTHAVDMNQRSLQLNVTAAGGGVVASTPTNQTVLPPGYYMLFLLNAQGVPSVASWVRIDPALAAPVYAPDPTPGTPAGGGGSSAGAGSAPAALVPSPRGAGSTLGKVKVTLSKVKITRKGRWLVATFVLRGKTAFTAKAKLGRLGKRSRLMPPVASKKVRAATVKKAKAVPMKLTMKAPKTRAKLRLGLRVDLSAKGARATTLSRTLAVPRAR
jgi:hypothetical protein